MHTIITTEPNQLMSELHNRMPVILPKTAENTWIDPTIQDPHILNDLLAPFPSLDMEAYRVREEVNSPKNDHVNLTKPVD